MVTAKDAIINEQNKYGIFPSKISLVLDSFCCFLNKRFKKQNEYRKGKLVKISEKKKHRPDETSYLRPKRRKKKNRVRAMASTTIH